MGVEVHISDKFEALSNTWVVLSEATLILKNAVIPVEVIHDIWKNDMFHHFVRDARKGYRTVVGGVGFYALFEYRMNDSEILICWDDTCVKTLLQK